MQKIDLVTTLQGHTDRTWQISWSPTTLALASCSSDKSIRTWSFQNTWVYKTLDNAHTRTIRSISYNPNGRLLASGSFDATTAIWEQNECLATLEGHENEVKSVSWSPSGDLLATCSRDKSVWIWEGNIFKYYSY